MDLSEKKKLLEINSVCGIGSTGRIAFDIAKEYEQAGYEVRIAYGRNTIPKECKKYAVQIGNIWSVRFHGILSRLFDAHGLGSRNATKRFLRWATEFDPDVLWLHNIHGYYINIELLFEWIKSRPDMKVKWTLHDCWAFTGHCAHFDFVGCEKWKNCCEKCQFKKAYPTSMLFDNSRMNYLKKKQIFCGVENMEIITPSIWLANLVKDSFLSEYEVSVIHNSIDLSVFKETPSNFREKYHLNNYYIILGVASSWGPRKGLDDFIKLSKMISEDYKIVLVGLTKKQIKKIPSNIIAIEKTNNARELAQIYTAADVFLNLTYEDNYPTVNLEAQACGTPCITYRTGGSVESVPKENVVDKGDLLSAYGLLQKMISER